MPAPVLHLLDAAPDLLDRAHAALCPEEAAACAAFKFPKRRHDWLLGRLAAKEAVRRAADADWPLTAIRIHAQPSGCPTFEAPDDALAGWHLSITHGHGRAGAAVAPAPIGLDFEALRAVPEKGWRFFLTPAERAWLADHPLGPESEIVAWALKEAAYKALQGAVSGVLKLTLTSAAEGTAAIASPEGPLAARYTRLPDACLAVAVLEGDRPLLTHLTLA